MNYVYMYLIVGVIFSTTYMVWLGPLVKVRTSFRIQIAVYAVMAVLWLPIVIGILMRGWVELKRCLKKQERDER